MAVAERPLGAVGNARKFIEKLALAGQLRAGFLLRVLLDGQTELFDLAFAQLLDLDIDEFRRVFYAQDAQGAALACRAVGIDRSVFPTVFGLSARAGATPPAAERGTVERAFGLAKPEALERLRSYG